MSPKIATREIRVPRPALSPRELPPGLLALSNRGTQGGVIPLHRAFLRASMSTAQIVLAVASPILLSAAWIYFGPIQSAIWSLILESTRKALAMPGNTMVLVTNLGPVPEVQVPFLNVPAAHPSPRMMIWTAIGTLVLGLLSLIIRGRLLPLAYLLRLAVIVQTTALIYFLFWPTAFPYGIDDYMIAEMTAGFGLIALMPLVLGLIYFIFDFSFLRKLGLTLVVMLHLAVLIPFQFVIHAYIIHRFSLLFMPILFILFGLLLEVSVGIAFYGWAMSWQSRSGSTLGQRA